MVFSGKMPGLYHQLTNLETFDILRNGAIFFKKKEGQNVDNLYHSVCRGLKEQN